MKRYVPGPKEASMEERKLEIELQKLEIENKKLGIEKSKLVWSSLAGMIPLIGIIAKIFYGIWTQRQSEKNTFQLKAAEIMFNSADSYEAKINAQILKQLFPDKLPPDFSNSFNPDSISGYDSYLINSKKDLLKLLSSNTRDARIVIEYWKRAFPDDLWVDTILSAIPPTHANFTSQRSAQPLTT
jgi:hypothetical protein